MVGDFLLPLPSKAKPRAHTIARTIMLRVTDRDTRKVLPSAAKVPQSSAKQLVSLNVGSPNGIPALHTLRRILVTLLLLVNSQGKSMTDGTRMPILAALGLGMWEGPGKLMMVVMRTSMLEACTMKMVPIRKGMTIIR